MSSNICPKCEKELTREANITNIHLTGDEKYMNLYRCKDCEDSFLKVSVYATVSYGDNYFAFRIKLTEEEAKEIKEKMLECPEPDNEECGCAAHGFLDSFDNNNKDRRVILADEKDRWVKE